jgi:hypothetical protein
MGTRHGLKPRIAVSPQRIAPSPPGRRRPSTGITLLFIACVFLVVGGSAIFLYTSVLQPGQFRAQTVDSAAAKATGTAQADVRSTANIEATAQIRDKAAATVRALAFAHATATAALRQHVFTQETKTDSITSQKFFQPRKLVNFSLGAAPKAWYANTTLSES